jgi:hypothetical protein
MPSHFIAFWNLENLIAMCNHWPSRSGGTYESRGYRMTAGETPSYWHQRVWEEKGSDTAIIAMDDFNDDPFDGSVLIHARATRERGDVERATIAARFYNLTWRYLEQKGEDNKGNAAKHVNTSGFSDHFPVSVILQEQ